jgi:hypothetical protein
MSDKLRVLIVEDNPADADFIQETLAEAGPVSFLVESVSRLSEAFTRIESKGIDLVFLDLGLPDSQGLQTLHKLREEAPEVPVIVLTGTDDQELAVTAVRDGAQDYLVKGQFNQGLLTRSARYAVERQKADAALRHQAEELLARNDRLNRFNQATVGRELRMIELKREVNELCGKLGQPARHRIVGDETALPAAPEAQA